MREYKEYTKAQFERMLWILKAELGLGYIQEVSDALAQRNENGEIFEYVYAIPTQLSNVRILVYSSVDKRTQRTRDYAEDAVRFVIESKVGNTIYRKRLGKRLRIETLQKNMGESIQKGLHYLTNLQVRRSA